MTKKFGRPLKGESGKFERFEFRLSKEEKEKLETLSKKTGMSKTDIILKGIEIIYNQEMN